MNTESPVKAGLIGLGGIAQAYLEAFDRVGSCNLVAVTDLDPSRMNAATEGRPINGYASFDDMLAGEKDLEAVFICTPPNTHEDLTLKAVEAGLHVLCEKPLSTSVESADRMKAAAEKHNRILTMASKFRYVDDVLAAKELVDYGQIGDVILFENAFTSFVDMSGRWNSNPDVSGGGVLIDNGTHSLDIARYFLGPISDVRVIEGRRCQGLDVEETVTIFVKSDQGVLGNIDLSWTIHKPAECFINIYGSKGMICVGWQESRYRVGNGDWIKFGNGYDKVRAFTNQIGNFSRSIRGTEELRITSADGVASVRAVTAAYKALEEEPWVRIRSTKNAVAKKLRAQSSK